MRPALALVLLALGLASCGSGDANPGEGEHYTEATWAQLVSDPDAHKGATVEIVGKVFTEPERDEGTTLWQMWAKPNESEWNTVVGIQDPAFKISNGDYVEVRGTVTGKFEAENAFGAKISGVTVRASSARVVDPLAAAPKPDFTLDRRETSLGPDISIAVEKIEVASEETRVHVTVGNFSDAKLSIYAHSAKIVNGAGEQFEPQFSGAGYPELAAEVVPGAQSKGVITFGKVRVSDYTKFVIEGYSADTTIGEYGSFTVTLEWQ